MRQTSDEIGENAVLRNYDAFLNVVGRILKNWSMVDSIEPTSVGSSVVGAA
jgi:hypothetical protein